MATNSTRDCCGSNVKNLCHECDDIIAVSWVAGQVIAYI